MLRKFRIFNKSMAQEMHGFAAGKLMSMNERPYPKSLLGFSYLHTSIAHFTFKSSMQVQWCLSMIGS